ncbi:MAG TPA: glycosyltransferase, partial [Thermoleophilaceae bacterium]|nr:glycosyltransferase [Thermoleophilaceae bacterium]
MSRRLVSLVVPNMNNGPALDVFFRKLERNTSYPEIELVVADDGSTDSSLRVLRRWRDSGRFP